jgi:hypothetical protein
VPALLTFVPDSFSHFPGGKPTANQITDYSETKQSHLFTLLFLHGILLVLMMVTLFRPFFWLPSSEQSGQGYNSVGWLFHASILLLSGTTNRDNILL